MFKPSKTYVATEMITAGCTPSQVSHVTGFSFKVYNFNDCDITVEIVFYSGNGQEFTRIAFIKECLHDKFCGLVQSAFRYRY